MIMSLATTSLPEWVPNPSFEGRWGIGRRCAKRRCAPAVSYANGMKGASNVNAGRLGDLQFALSEIHFVFTGE